MDAVGETLMSDNVLLLHLPDIIIDYGLREPVGGYSTWLSFHTTEGLDFVGIRFTVHAQLEWPAATKEIRCNLAVKTHI